MRLLKRKKEDDFSLTEFSDGDIPPYAILSHTWGAGDDEVTLRGLIEGTGKSKKGYTKIRFCGNQAAKDNLEYFWIDTCCIDKTNSAELSESINSMFNWYQNAKVCYVYLADVSRDKCDPSEISRATWQQAFKSSKWFSRGWTLQELIAPASVRFFDMDGSPLGDKVVLKEQVCDITGITETALLGAPLTNFRVSERYDWARSRQTTREEDWAYSLQGIFGVFLPPIYGEGRPNAVHRLVKEIKETSLRGGVRNFVIDSDGHGQVVNPLLLDIALLETLSLFDEARLQAERYGSNVHNNAQVLRANDVLVSDTASAFLEFLYGLLRYIFLPLSGHKMLQAQFDVTSSIIHGIIASNKKIASNLRHDEENGQETLNKLNTAQDFIQGQIEASTQTTDAQPSALEEVEILKQYIGHSKLEIKEVEVETQQISIEEAKPIEKECTKLREQIPKLVEECRQMQQRLDRAVEELKQQQTETKAWTDMLEAKSKEAERMRDEWENKNIWQKIWAYIYWIFSFGSNK